MKILNNLLYGFSTRKQGTALFGLVLIRSLEKETARTGLLLVLSSDVLLHKCSSYLSCAYSVALDTSKISSSQAFTGESWVYMTVHSFVMPENSGAETNRVGWNNATHFCDHCKY